MSVNFFAEMSAIAGYEITCACRIDERARYGDFKDARDAMVALRDANLSIDGCTDVEFCSMYLSVDTVETDPSPYVNASNSNARMLLSLLGFDADDDMCGSESGAEFAARLDQAALLATAEPVVPVTVSGRNNNFIDCGRDADYATDRIESLREVADFCVRTGRKVVWS
jgi:hypothetical protein